jgi:hypothetical protein
MTEKISILNIFKTDVKAESKISAAKLFLSLFCVKIGNLSKMGGGGARVWL